MLSIKDEAMGFIIGLMIFLIGFLLTLYIIAKLERVIDSHVKDYGYYLEKISKTSILIIVILFISIPFASMLLLGVREAVLLGILLIIPLIAVIRHKGKKISTNSNRDGR